MFLNTIAPCTNMLLRSAAIASAPLCATQFGIPHVCTLTQVRHKTNQRRVRIVPVAKERDRFVNVAKEESSRKQWELEKQREAAIGDREPETNTRISTFHGAPSFSLQKCIEMHKEFAEDDRLANADGRVYLNILFNMATKRRGKFVPKIEVTVPLNHPIDFAPLNKVLALTDDESVAIKCREAGAVFAGGKSILQLIDKNEINALEFDSVVCTNAFLDKLSGKYRVFFREKFPSRQRNTVGDDVVALTQAHVHGIAIGSQRVVAGVDEEHVADIPLGRLNWPLEQLEANLTNYVDRLLAEFGPRVSGALIKRMIVRCPPSWEQFLLDKSIYQRNVSSQGDRASGAKRVEKQQEAADDAEEKSEEAKVARDQQPKAAAIA